MGHEYAHPIGGPFLVYSKDVHCVSFSSDGCRVVSGSCDNAVRIWNADTHEQMGEALQGHCSAVECVSESADGRHVVSTDCNGNTIIWNSENRAIFWKSTTVERDSQNEVTDEQNVSEENTTDGVRALKRNRRRRC